MKNQKHRLLWAVTVLLLAVMLGTLTVHAKKYDFNVDVESGYDGKVQVGSYAPFHVTVKNTGKDFTGTVQIITSTDQGNIMYEKDISIAAGATKKVVLTVPIMKSSGKVNVRLVNGKDKVVWSEKVKYSTITAISDINVAILSDDFGALGYMDGQTMYQYSNLTTKIFELKADDLSGDWRSLDMMDVLVITNYSTDQLTDDQITAIRYWVKNGGMLMVSSGSTASKTLAKLNGNLFDAQLGELNSYSTKLGLTFNDYSNSYFYDNYYDDYYYDQYYDESVEEEYNDELIGEDESTQSALVASLDYTDVNVLDVELDGVQGSSIYGEIEGGETYPLAEVMPMGEGYILLCGVDFTQTPLPEYPGSGLMFVSMIESTIGMQLYEDAQNYSDYWYNYDYDYGLEALYSGLACAKAPSVLLYAAILLAYVIAVPVVYGIMKRKKKYAPLWIAIPATALGFCLIIYIAGFTTRLLRPEVNVAKVWNVSQNRVEESAYAAVTLPNNKGGKVSFSAEYVVDIYNENDYWYDDPAEVNLDYYNLGITTTAEDYVVEICNNAALSTEKFVLEQTLQGTGGIASELVYIDNDLSGTITNNLSYDLSGVFFYINGQTYLIGELKAGETIELSRYEPYQFDSHYGSYYYMTPSDSDDFMKDLLPDKPSVVSNVLLGTLGGKYKEYAAKSSAIEYLCERNVYAYRTSINSGILMGLVDGEKEPVQSNGKYRERVTTAFFSELNAKNSLDGYTYSPYNADNVMILNDTDVSCYTSEGQELWFWDSSMVEAVYTFDHSVISFNMDFNEDTTSSYFRGNIYFYNKNTQIYDLISSEDFMSVYAEDNTVVLDEYADYIWSDGQNCSMRIVYEPDMTFFSTYEDILLPILYMKMEE